ncbi:MAG TPA: TonB-dependent receptor [Polyangia bacterium]|jgi:outer membrane receptor protein involved in Fe transport
MGLKAVACCGMFTLFTGIAAQAQVLEPDSAVSVDESRNETVVTTPSPLHGSRLPRDHVAMNVQTVTADELASSEALDLSEYMNDNLGSVSVNQAAGSPLQPDLQYRGYLSSPLVGAPQGLSVYLNGMKLNEAFGDTVNWDLIPTNAIRSMNLMPGSNPLFGLNTLGGAISMETKTGFSDPGANVHLSGGSFLRRQLDFELGGHGEKWAYFAAGRYFAEDGWREDSPSRTFNGFLSTSYSSGPTFVDLVLAVADTNLTGNGATPEQLLAMDRRAIFTYPDRSQNRMFLAMLRGERTFGPHLRLSGALFDRLSRAKTDNGDQRDWAACTAPGQTSYLCSTDEDTNQEAVVLDRSGNPLPFDDSYNAANNSTRTMQQQFGLTGQLAVEAPLANRENHLFIGAAADEGRSSFTSQSTVASLTESRGTNDTGVVDPNSPVAVDTVVNNLGVYASDTFSARPDLFLTLSGRFNYTSLSLRDQLGDDLTGDHSFHRFNPSAGVSYQPLPVFGVYGNYGESARAPTPIELTCASPTDPCRLPNAFVADPPLAQVVARTFEAGTRGRWKAGRTSLDYTGALFRTANSNDIIFISSGMVANQGFFANVGDTRRQGVEASLHGRHPLGGNGARLDWWAHYTYLDATFETPFAAPSQTHPDADMGSISVAKGAHLPSIPAHVGKLNAMYSSAFGLAVGAAVIANTSQFYRGDEANLLAPLPGYVVVNLMARYRITRLVSVHARVNNVFDANYSTFGVLGDPAEVLGPTFDNPRFRGPGAPRSAWLGVDLHI